MSRRWYIRAGDVHGTHHRTHLIGCSLAKDSHTGQYLFLGPEANGLPLAAADITVPFQPFVFPKFTAALNGPDSLDWYIRVHQADDGPDGTANGFWSNKPFQAPPGDDRPPQAGDPDTWTTQAGVGVDPEDNKKDKQKAAGSASST